MMDKTYDTSAASGTGPDIKTMSTHSGRNRSLSLHMWRHKASLYGFEKLS